MTDDMTLTGARVMATVVATDIVQVGVRLLLHEGEAQDAPAMAVGIDPATGEKSVGLTLGSAVTPDPVIGARWRGLWLSVEIGREQAALDIEVACGDHATTISLDEAELRRLRDEFGARRLPIEADGAYDAWFRAHRTSEAELAEQRLAAASLPTRPLFSVIVPLYHTPVDFFHEMADSVLCQTYDNLELVLVNSTPADADLARAVADLAAADSRVRVVELERNLGITENTNAGIDVATGDFVCFFDHDDILEPDVLFHYATAIAADPKIDLLFCDEDKLEDGRYVFPTFKPDFCLLLLETNNYVCHMLTIRRELLRELPRATAVYDGAQDHRLGLVASERLRHTFHARKMLYHWRVSATSTAGNAQAKPESLEAGRRAIAEHLERIGVEAVVENVPTMAHCYEASLPEGAPLPSCALVLLGEAPESCTASADDLASDFGATHAVDLRHLETLEERLGAVDGAVRDLPVDYVLLSDARAPRPHEDGLLRRMAVVAARDHVGVTGARAVLADGSKCGGAVAFGLAGLTPIDLFMPAGDHQARGFEVFPHEVSAVTGHLVMIRRDLLLDLGLDAALGSLWSVGLCCEAARHGLSTAEVPLAMVEVDADEKSMRLASGPAFDAGDRGQLQACYPEVACAPSPYYSDIFETRGYFGLGNGRASL